MAATLRKYITISPSADVSSDDLGKAFKKMTIAHNRMGGAVTNIGVQLTEFKELVGMYQESTVGFLEQEKDISEKESEHRKDIIKAKSSLLNRKEGLQQDKLAEKKQETLNEKGEEKLGEEEGKKEKKSRFGWLKGLLKPMTLLIGGLVKLVAIPVLIGVMDWIGDPKNTEKIKKVLGFFVGVWKFANFFTRMGVGLVLDGITDVFGHDPDKGMIGGALDKMFGVLKILAGFASIHLASRILMPWKLIGDVKFMFGLGKAVDAAEKGGCGPKLKKPRGNRVGRDGRTARQRLKDIKRAKRIRRIKALRSQITKKFTAAATGINGLFKKPPTPTVKPTPKTPFQLEQARKQATKQAMGLGDEVAEAAATNKGVVGTLRNIWSGALDAGAVAKTKLKEGGTFALKQVGRLNNWFGARAGAMIDGVKGMGQGIWDFGKRAGKSLGDVVEMAKNPKALAAKVTTKVKDFIKPILEKNPQAKKIAEFAELPKGQQLKQAGSSVVGFLKSGFKNPGFKTMREFLGAAKANMKIGGIDTLIASLMALLDYGVFGESPINAVLKALGGLLGYSAGFAIGAPFGGVPGFITGAAGGFAGEWAAEQLLGLLAKTGLADIDDPIAKQLGGDFPQRKLVRDPNGEMPGMEALMSAAENDGDGTTEITPPELPEMAVGGIVKDGSQKKKDLPKPRYTTSTKLVTKFDIPTHGEGQFKRFASGGLYVFSTAPAGAPKMMGDGKGYADTYPHHHPKPGGNVPRSGGIPRDYLISEKSNPATPDSKGDRHPIRAGVTGTVDSVGEGWGAVRIKDGSGPMFRSGHMTGIKVKVGDQVTPNTIIGIQDSVGMGNGYVHAHIEGKTPAIHNAWMRANIGAVSTDTGKDDVPATDDGSSPGKSGANAKSGDASGGGQPSATEQYRSTGSIVDFFKKSAGLLGQYAKDTEVMGGGLPAIPTTTSMPNAKVSGIGPLADGASYAESLKPAATVSAPPSKINTTADKLSSLSTSKVRRDKEPSKPNMMIAVQPVVKTNTVNAGGGGGGSSSPSSSPLLTK